jgi:hypothetical protein
MATPKKATAKKHSPTAKGQARKGAVQGRTPRTGAGNKKK